MDVATAIERLRSEAEALRRDGIVGLYLFGSVARGSADDVSDVDVFVDPDYTCFDFSALLRTERRLRKALGREVDLMTRESLHPSLRPGIERDAIRVL